MAYAPMEYVYDGSIEGIFTHAKTDACFEYIQAPGMGAWMIPSDKGLVYANKLIFVGPNQETRMAYIGKTVAYVIVDEDADGWVVEKWHIKKHVKYKDL